MKRLLVLVALCFAAATAAPAVNADPFYCDGPVGGVIAFVGIENAAACGGTTGLLDTFPHDGHRDCLYFSDWPYPRTWLVHGC